MLRRTNCALCCLLTGTYKKEAEPAEGIYPSQCGGANGSFRREFEAGAKVGFKEFAEQNGTLLLLRHTH
jgi:hypothetical protein